MWVEGRETERVRILASSVPSTGLDGHFIC